MEKADASDVVQTFVRLAPQAAIDPTEEESLIGFAKEQSGSNILSIKRTLKTAWQVHNKEKAEEERQRRVAERNDPPAHAGGARTGRTMVAANGRLQ